MYLHNIYINNNEYIYIYTHISSFFYRGVYSCPAEPPELSFPETRPPARVLAPMSLPPPELSQAKIPPHPTPPPTTCFPPPELPPQPVGESRTTRL